MSENTLFHLVFLFLINTCFAGSADHITHEVKNFKQSSNNDVDKGKNETDFSQKLHQNIKYTGIYYTNISDDLFWTIYSNKEATRRNVELQNNTKKAVPEEADDQTESSEEIKEVASTSIKPPETTLIYDTNDKNSNQDVWLNTKMNEKITLERNNCYLEIDIQENFDLKTEISFGKLENNTSGKCCITLNGNKNSRLGIFISNVHLYQCNSEEEILKVITAEFGIHFLLKKYNSMSNYQPLLLTETHRVYIILNYNVTNVPVNAEDSFFNLEVFSYYK